MVEKTKHGYLRLATSKGILRTTYARHRVSLCGGVSRDLVQLEEAYNASVRKQIEFVILRCHKSNTLCENCDH